MVSLTGIGIAKEANLVNDPSKNAHERYKMKLVFEKRKGYWPSEAQLSDFISRETKGHRIPSSETRGTSYEEPFSDSKHASFKLIKQESEREYLKRIAQEDECLEALPAGSTMNSTNYTSSYSFTSSVTTNNLDQSSSSNKIISFKNCPFKDLESRLDKK